MDNTTKTDRYLGAEGGMLEVCDSLRLKFALARVWWEPFPGRVYIRYATGYSEYLTPTQARGLLAA